MSVGICGFGMESVYVICHIKDLEKVQKRATKMIKACQHLSYNKRLIYLKLPTLTFRRIRGDMIEVYKILNGYPLLSTAIVRSLEFGNLRQVFW